MLELRALRSARVYRREPMVELNNRDVKTEREARESILGMNSTWCLEALGKV